MTDTSSTASPIGPAADLTSEQAANIDVKGDIHASDAENYDDITAPDQFAAIEAQLIKGNLPHAYKLAQAYLAEDGNNPWALHGLSLVLRQLERKDEALGYARQAQQLSQNKAPFVNGLAVLLRQLKRSNEAISLLIQFLADHKDFQQGWNNLGLALVDVNRFPEAETAFAKALEINRDFAEGWNNLGVMRSRQAKWSEAQACFEKALAVDEAFADGWLNRAEAINRQKGDPKAALASLKKAASLRPLHLPSQLLYSRALLQTGSAREALTQGMLVLPHHPNHEGLLFLLAEASLKLDDAVRATIFYRQILRHNPNQVQALRAMAELNYRLGAPLEALMLASRAKDLSPHQDMSYWLLAFMQLALGQERDAATSLSRVLTMQPNHHPARIEQAKLLLKAQDFQKGFALYENRLALASSPLSKAGPIVKASKKPDWGQKAAAKLIKADSDCKDKHLLVILESPLHLNFLLARFLPLIKTKWPDLDKISVIGPDDVTRLFGQLFPFAEVYAHEDAPTLGDEHLVLPLASLPHLLSIGFSDIAKYRGQEIADAFTMSSKMKLPDASTYTLKIGVCLDAGFGADKDYYHSIKHAGLEKLFTIEDNLYIPLALHKIDETQKPDGKKTKASTAAKTKATGKIQPADPFQRYYGKYKNVQDFSSWQNDYLAIARLISTLDLVITADSAIGHLAGAMGKPCWFALSAVPEWYWHDPKLVQNDNDVPLWYPESKLFRQSIFGDWSLIAHDLYQKLLKLADTQSGT